MDLYAELAGNAYPGRGIVLGTSQNGKYAVCVYFIMGRSENSRNRVFVADGAGIRTQAFDPSRVKDPSLIIYAPVRVIGDCTIVTNGDQTDTIHAQMKKKGLGKRASEKEMANEGKAEKKKVRNAVSYEKALRAFDRALRTREFEPDAPNYTPRISGMIYAANGTHAYALSILKAEGGDPAACARFTFAYAHPLPGVGHLLHTYQGDGDPLPSFCGEPKRVIIPDDIDELTDRVWDALNEENKVSLFVRYIKLKSGKSDSRIINKNK